MPNTRASICVLTVLCLTACATSHVIIGKVRPPISPDAVELYMRPPATHYEEIARLDASSEWSFAFGAQAKTDALIRRLKAEAAKLGANGVLLQGIGDQPSGSVGTGGGTQSFSGSGFVGGGIGINLETTRKVGGGLAIYVEPR
ncbi:MAG TPA: hypothetical protein VMC02_04375 [Steroidobacteraceae bacterium]|nr:hypothetical protein [Steroidobacteraceae bacterium]